ncbi:MAG TPA: hypothetical protein VID28_14915 [Methylomirabilota bacterium]|jgi:hypothetical protein
MRLLWIPLAALLLAGCAVVPVAPPYAYVPRPRPRFTYVYPAYPGYAPGWYAPRYYGHW